MAPAGPPFRRHEERVPETRTAEPRPRRLPALAPPRPTDDERPLEARDLFRVGSDPYWTGRVNRDPRGTFYPSSIVQPLERPDPSRARDLEGFRPAAAAHLAEHAFVARTLGNVEYEGGAVPAAFAALEERYAAGECVEVRLDLPLLKVEPDHVLSWDPTVYNDRKRLDAERLISEPGITVPVWMVCHRRQRRGAEAAVRHYAARTFWAKPSKYRLKNGIYVARSLRQQHRGERPNWVGWIDLRNAYLFAVDEGFFLQVLAVMRGETLRYAA